MFRSILPLLTLFLSALSAPLFTESSSDPFPDIFSQIVQRQAAPASCPPSHLIIARGSLEAPGPGSLISMGNKIIAANPGTTMEAVVYPATIDNYGTSSGNGTVAVMEMLGAFVQRCPNAKLAMLGYSQGAQIIGDAVAGGGIMGVSSLNPPIRADVSALVDAMVFYGDPRHNAIAPYNVGTATKDGVFTRPANQTLSPFAEKIQSYCNTNDPFCSSGNNLTVHLIYPQEFDDAGAAFVNKRFQSQQALAKAQGASAASTSLPPPPAAAVPVPPPAVATLVSSPPPSKVNVVNATEKETVPAKEIVKPWANAVAKSVGAAAREESGGFEGARKLLLERMGKRSV